MIDDSLCVCFMCCVKKNKNIRYHIVIVNMKESRSYAYSLENAMQHKWSHGWNQHELWSQASKKKVTYYKMKDILHWIYKPCWSNQDATCFYSIFQMFQEVASKKKKKETDLLDHFKRTKKSDISYPLIVAEDTYDSYGTILDGNHRFAKAILKKKKRIPIVFFSTAELKSLKKMITD
jgi:hypothetical protein